VAPYPELSLARARYLVLPGESVLDSLERQGVPAASQCRRGHCGVCVIRARSGCVPPEAQAGLPPSRVRQGYFFACRCYPETDLELELDADAGTRHPARVSRRELRGGVLRLWLEPRVRFDYHPGQHLTLVRPDGLSRCYSLASLPEERELELHVRRVPGGRMSEWIHDQLEVGSLLEVRGPRGDSYYAVGAADQPLLLAGVGSGLAPLYGVVRAALAQEHTGPILLVHGARAPEGLYLQEELHTLAARHETLTVVGSLLSGAAPECERAPLEDVLSLRVPDLRGWRVFLAGSPTRVHALRRWAYLSGARLIDIHADAFHQAPGAVRP
jgi:NAD(P)H-flavin reductase/ferredoxin